MFLFWEVVVHEELMFLLNKKVHVNNRISYRIYLPIHDYLFHRRNHLPSPPPSSTSSLSPLKRVRSLIFQLPYFILIWGSFNIYFPTTMINTSSDRTAMTHLCVKISTFKSKGVLFPILNLHVYVTICFLSIFNTLCFWKFWCDIRILSLSLYLCAIINCCRCLFYVIILSFLIYLVDENVGEL